MNKIPIISLLVCLIMSCSNQKESIQRVADLESQVTAKDKEIARLKDQIKSREPHQTDIWYAFEPNTEYNIVRLGSGNSEIIDAVELVDSVDVVYTFRHEATITQLRDNRAASMITNFRQFEEISHNSRGYGPSVSQASYHVKTIVLCEEEGLPIEVENCTSNIYILVMPTELGYESNLFRVSRLFNAVIKSLSDTPNGVILTIEHSRFPRKELKVLIRPELVKFIE
ncbi:hypothetical protein [Roseivirga sp.]|uniref:hypothetical protein n=1 Tax=Roseivirga sp. TaxID=1964215 RepID=UPI003B52F690